MTALHNIREEIKNLINEKKEDFQGDLLTQAVNVSGRINEILEKGNIDLLRNAQRLIILVFDEKEEELTAFANREGIAWAEHSLTLSLKLEWVQAIRRTVWQYISLLSEKIAIRESSVNFFDLEKRINDQIDQFLTVFSLVIQNIRTKCI